MMAGDDHVLRLDGLNAYYGTSWVVRDVDLEVRPGEVVALLGRNGAGKSTTVHAIAGLLRKVRGSVKLGSATLTGQPPYRRTRAGLGLVPTGGRLFPTLSVRENLEMSRGRKVENPRTLEQVYEVFPKLATIPDRIAQALSGGERQMVAIGRALMANPAVIVLDEPSEGLAPSIVDTVAAAVSELRSAGIGVLLCEQNHRFALSVADRVSFMEKGEIKDGGLDAGEVGGDVLARYLGT
jgi:branched-chain amino acid transport system ATP-binding protein